MSEKMSFDVTLELPFAAAVENVIACLKDEGFGILTRADIHTAFKEKLNKDFRPYTILGACNPPLAHKALSSRPDAGLMLPCNVIVEGVEDGTSMVRIVNPEAMMKAGGFDGDPVMDEVGNEALQRLERVAGALGYGK